MADPLGIALEPGQILHDTYRVLEQIGAGAMGAVYRVEELGNGMQWALKVPRAGLSPEEYGSIIDLYRSEAEILAKLSHPNLPQVREHFPYPGGHCLVFELLPGGALDQHLARAVAAGQQLDVTLVVGWGVQIARALEYLHSRQPPIILKDLKPENIMLAGDGSVRLIDFGIAKEHSSSGGHTVAIGTEAYAAPDHYGLMGRTDERTDVFTLGATLYHLLTGRTQRETRRPSSRGHPNSAVQVLFPGPPQPAHELNPQVPPELAAIVQRCLEIEPAQRYQSASEVRPALEALIGETALAPPERARPWQALRQSLEKLQRTIPPSLRTSMQSLPKTLAPTLRESWQQARALLGQVVSGQPAAPAPAPPPAPERHCPHCGSQLRPQARFCSSCGADMANPHLSRFKLVVVRGAQPGREYRLARGLNYLGAGAEVDLAVDAPELPARQAQLVVQGDRVIITHLGAKFSTLVRGRRLGLQQAVKLAVGDEITLGALVLRLAA